jgi:hypothetical protein
VFTGLALAEEGDDRERVASIADIAEIAKLEDAAVAALKGTYEDVREFLHTGWYEGKEHDDRTAILQLLTAGGPAVRAAAQAALEGTDADREVFLREGQYEAREHDDRIAVLQIMSTAGPHLKAAGEVALAGPRAYLRDFLDVVQHKARRLDEEATTHVARVESLVSDAMASAASASADAARAAEAAATARRAAAEAAGYAAAARRSEAEAAGYAREARQSANRAQASAERAAQSAKIAREAAASADRAADEAASSAAAADRSAAWAAASAKAASASAERARAAALAAGRDAAAAARAREEVLALAVSDPLAVDPPESAEAQGEDPGLSEADIGILILDVLGIVDQSGFSDAASGFWSALRGDWVSAGYSALGIIPIVGDTGKIPKIARMLKKAFPSLAARLGDRKTLLKVLNAIATALRENGPTVEAFKRGLAAALSLLRGTDAVGGTVGGTCEQKLELCLDNPWQPKWNREDFGWRKDCGACYRECRHNEGSWPDYKCPWG